MKCQIIKMPPKPVRIGLTKRRREEDSDDESVVAPLSVSLMNALEDIVTVNVDPNEEEIFEESEDLFADDIDRDRDPDYVQPEPQPGTSRREKAVTQPALNLVTTETAGKGRSSAPIWNFFNVSDKKVNGRIEKGAMCKVDVGGVPCGKRIMQNGSSTTGLNQHLERRHPAAFEQCKTLQTNLQAEKMATKRTLNDHFDNLEGRNYHCIRQSDST